VFPVTTNANAALKNERLEGFEAGIDFILPEGAEFSLTAFDNRVENAIANVTLNATTRERQNLDAISAQGLEFTARLGGDGPLSFFGTLTYSDARMEGSGVQAALDGFRPPQTPEWSASATLSYEPQDGMRFAATLRHVGDQFEADDETDLLPSATTLDLFAQVRFWRELSLVFRAENVFDETIVTRNQGGSMDVGAPATFWGGLRWGY
ncbi:MAG TPA: TonB-dependent receptor, partial [Sphingomonadaceae bacterium]|nr:TonB-dependent receptor [Sphingomonadaceae bacterium]